MADIFLGTQWLDRENSDGTVYTVKGIEDDGSIRVHWLTKNGLEDRCSFVSAGLATREEWDRLFCPVPVKLEEWIELL